MPSLPSSRATTAVCPLLPPSRCLANLASARPRRGPRACAADHLCNPPSPDYPDPRGPATLHRRTTLTPVGPFLLQRPSSRLSLPARGLLCPAAPQQPPRAPRPRLQNHTGALLKTRTREPCAPPLHMAVDAKYLDEHLRYRPHETSPGYAKFDSVAGNDYTTPMRQVPLRHRVPLLPRRHRERLPPPCTPTTATPHRTGLPHPHASKV